jgi:hypothetical protein
MPTLIARLEGAEGGSDELSALVMCETLAPAGAYAEKSPFNGAWCIYAGLDRRGQPRLWERRGRLHRPDGWPVTTSLDAALALVAEKLPGHCALLAITPERTVCNLHTKPIGQIGNWHPHAEATTAPLAICAALLKALHPKESVNAG